MSTAPGSEVKGSKGAANKSYIKHSTSDDTLGSTASVEVCSCQSEWQTKEEQINDGYKRKPQKANSNHGYEGLLSLMQSMLMRMANMDKTRKPPPRVKQVWVKNDETIHHLRGSGLT
jgi:hypothetical protein